MARTLNAVAGSCRLRWHGEAIGGLAAKAGHTDEVMSRDAAKAHSIKHTHFSISVRLLGWVHL